MKNHIIGLLLLVDIIFGAISIAMSKEIDAIKKSPIDVNIQLQSEDVEVIGRQSYMSYKGVKIIRVGKRNHKCTLAINYSLSPPICIKSTAKCKPVPKKPITFTIDRVHAVLTVSVYKNKVSRCSVDSSISTTTATTSTTSETISAPCSGTTSDWSCCSSSSPCPENQGDCDNNSECAGSLVCGNDNCKSINPLAHSAADCCIKPAPCTGTTSDWSCCSSSSPCLENQGDCDNDSECAGSLVCGNDNCKSINHLAHSAADCCIKPDVPEKVLDEIRAKIAQDIDDSIRKLSTKKDVDDFLMKQICTVSERNKCLKTTANAVLSSGCLSKSTVTERMTCIVATISKNPKNLPCLKCFSTLCEHIANTCDLLPTCCSTGEKKRISVPGHLCNRDCTDDTTFYTCEWTFIVKNQYSDTDGRRADGRNRSILTYNDILPGPSIIVCELDNVNITLKNEIQGTYEKRHGQSNGTTLHIHGIRNFGQSYEDGVPGVNQCEVPPKHGENQFNYTLVDNPIDRYHENSPPGTYWYHSHLGSQRTNGLYGTFIIKPRSKSSHYDVDDGKNTLVLQEWYKTDRINIPISILINGNGRVGATMNSVPNNTQWDIHVDKYNKGQQVHFDQIANPIYGIYNTNYTEFDVNNYTTRYRFRIIGAISQNFPLCVSIEEHMFTAIATDSIDFKPVKDLDSVCLTAGERYDIVIKTKSKEKVRTKPYKIKVFGKSSKTSPLCTVAWLKYPGQKVNYSYVTNSTCYGFDLQPSWKVLNPVMDLSFKNTSQHITLNELRAAKQPTKVEHNLRYTHYFELRDLTFNNISMTYNDVPFLFQNPPKTKNRCGPSCNEFFHWDGTPFTLNFTCGNYTIPDGCVDGKKCQCEHVVNQPGVPGFIGIEYWFETILVNPYIPGMSVAHPIHQHGGWYSVVGVKQFDTNTQITREYIIELDKKCAEGYNCLPRNFDHPIQKDTIQVPVNGYVIYRTPLDNTGTWLIHCHINSHMEAGMAMVLQIGGLKETFHVGILDFPVNCTGSVPSFSQEWSLGPFKNENNKKCPRKLNYYQNPASIDWFYGMKPIVACALPGQSITFTWDYGHNVNLVTKEVWENCNPEGNLPPDAFANKTATHGDWTWTGNNTKGIYYFACGVDDGNHCKYGGLKAMVTVGNCGT